MTLGLSFFAIQMAMFILLNCVNIIIANRCSLEAVTIYNVTHQYFFVILTVSNIIAGPFWVAYTDAYTKQDFTWMKKCVSKLTRIWFGLCLLALFMLFISSKVFEIWIGHNLPIAFSTSAAMCFFALVSSLATIYMLSINGTGKIRLQLYCYIASAVIAPILMCAVPAKLPTIIMVLTFIYLVQIILGRIQLQKITSNTANNIWNK